MIIVICEIIETCQSIFVGMYDMIYDMYDDTCDYFMIYGCLFVNSLGMVSVLIVYVYTC